MSQPKAYMLHGFLGVGKTTFAQRLEQECNAVRFTHDEWMSRLYGSDPPAAHFQDYALRVSGLIEDIWTRCLTLGSNVVLDFGFWSRTERDHTRDLVSTCGAEAVLYRMTCSNDEACRRIQRRNRDLGGSLYITPRTYEQLKSQFEPLGDDETFEVLDTGE